MRTTTAPELTTLADPTRQITQRYKVANGSGTLIDLTSWVEDTGNNIDIDRPASALTVLFRRDSGTTLSLSPLRTDSTLNRLDDGTTYSPQLLGGRRLTWEVATTPIGTPPVAGDYKFLFDGFIDVIDFDHSPISCDCRDKGGVLVDRGVEVEAPYGSVSGVALETVMQAILDATFGGGVIPLDVPVSPSYLVSPIYIQQRQSMMDAMQVLAQLPGWDVRYWYDTGSATFKFRLQQPPRTKTTPDHTFGPSSYYDITRLSIDRTNIKNVIAVSYFDATLGYRDVVTVADATSITKYGRRYFYLQEDDGSPISTNAEATAMANAILSDLKEPKAEAEIELPFFWPAELWDLYRFTANGVHINSDQDWAVVSISHKLRRNHHRTVLTVRGAVSGGFLTWLDRPKGPGHRPGEVGPEPRIEVFGPPSGLTYQLRYSATGGTAPLTYERRIDVDGVSTGTYSPPALLGVGVLEWVTIQPYYATRVFLRVTDATGLEGNADPFFLQGDLEPIHRTTGRVRRNIPLDDGKHAVKASDTAGGTVDTTVIESGGKLVNRLFAKPLAADPDGFDSVPDGTTYKRIVSVSGGQATAASLGSLSVTDAKVNDVAAGKTTAGTFVSGVLESGGKAINRIFAKALAGDTDTLDSAPDGTTYKKITGVSSGQITANSVLANALVDMCFLADTTGNTIATATPSSFNWNTELADDAGMHDSGFLAAVFLQHSGGLVFISSKITWDSNTTGLRTIRITKNDVTEIEKKIQPAAAVAGADQMITSVDYQPVDGDYYRIEATQDSGANRTVTFKTFKVAHLKI